jgi:hypothetical protein
MHFAPSPLASRRAKRTAIDQYRSQHHGLQRGLILGRALDAVGYGERVGWVRGEPITW